MIGYYRGDAVSPLGSDISISALSGTDGLLTILSPGDRGYYE